MSEYSANQEFIKANQLLRQRSKELSKITRSLSDARNALSRRNTWRAKIKRLLGAGK